MHKHVATALQSKDGPNKVQYHMIYFELCLLIEPKAEYLKEKKRP